VPQDGPAADRVQHLRVGGSKALALSGGEHHQGQRAVALLRSGQHLSGVEGYPCFQMAGGAPIESLGPASGCPDGANGSNDAADQMETASPPSNSQSFNSRSAERAPCAQIGNTFRQRARGGRFGPGASDPGTMAMRTMKGEGDDPSRELGKAN